MIDRVPKSQTVIIVNRLGMHARAAAKLAQLADQFKATVTLEKDNQVASADSIMELMMLTAGPGDEVMIKTTGPEAPEALAALVGLVQHGFGEELTTSKSP
jgi:phosphocarrier protein